MPTSPRSSQDSLDQAVKDFLLAAPAANAAPPRQPGASSRPSVSPARLVEPPEESEGLRRAYAGVLKHEAEKAATAGDAAPPLWRKLLMPVALLLLIAASAYVWFGHPAFLAPPPHAALKPPATPVTGQRQLVAIALEIDDFRRTTGRLPSDLPELGLNVPHINYKALPDGGYELRLGTGPHSLYYLGGSNAEPRIQTGDSP